MSEKRPYNKVQEDVHYFFETIREIHPDPYAYISKEKFDSLENAMLENSENLGTMKELNLGLMQCNQYFDGHTYCGVYPFSLLSRSRFNFPIKVYGDTIVWKPTGERVFAIDTFKAEDYIKKVKRFLPYDMHEKIKEERCTDDTYFLLLNNFTPPCSIELYDKNSGEVVRYEYGKMEALPETYRYIPPYRAYYYSDSIAVLEYNTCLIPNTQAWERFLKSFFDRVFEQKINHVFLDIRRNGGGSDVYSEMIYSYLSFNRDTLTVKLKMTKKGAIAVRNYVLTHPFSFGNVSNWVQVLKDYSCRDTLTEVSINYQASSGYDDYIYILQGCHTYSSGSAVSYHMKYFYKNSVLVGEETGQFMPMFGNKMNYELPNSKIPFCVGSQKNVYEGDFREENGFLLPDIPYIFHRPDTLFPDELRQVIKKKQE